MLKRLSINLDDPRPGVLRPELGATIPEILQLLRAGAVVTAARSLAEDKLDPARSRRVPIMVKTDGVWVWTAASEYYLDRYGVLPSEEFVVHARDSHFVVPAVSEERLREILAEVSAGPTIAGPPT